jgi:hypothetical protein
VLLRNTEADALATNRRMTHDIGREELQKADARLVAGGDQDRESSSGNQEVMLPLRWQEERSACNE